MITITLNEDKHRVEMEGHAGYAKEGQDIVCSACTALFYTLQESLRLFPAEAYSRKPTFTLKKGKGVIKCNPSEAFTPNIDTVYWTVFNGFKALAEGYPENVKIIVV